MLLTTAGLCAAADAKAPKPAPLVDINGASVAQLQKLPGIDAAVAEKIVAGRPYGSKAQLAARGIVDMPSYTRIKTLIVARQPFKDARRNAAALTKNP